MRWHRSANRLGVGVATIALVAGCAAGTTTTPRGTVSPVSSTPTATQTATPTPQAATSTRVTSIPALLTALADNTVTDIVVANGTYRVSPAGTGASNSLWIGSRYAGRTRPVTVRAETRGVVTFDGGGTTNFGGLSFVEGAHDQTWDGFTFANGEATNTGVIVFGGYPGRAAPHHITLRNIAIEGSCTGHNDRNDHGVYFSYAVGGPHDIVIDGLTVDGTGPTPLSSGLHVFHSDATNANAWNVTVRNLRITGTQQAIMLWDATLHDIVIEDSTITDAKDTAVRYEYGSGITLRRVTSTGSGKAGFYSSLGANPPGVTFIDSVLH